MCQYCEKQNEFAKSTDLSLTIEEDTLIVESNDDWANSCREYKEKINFCPMCGRRLSNENILSDKEIVELAEKYNPNYEEPTNSLEYTRWNSGFVAGYKKALSNEKNKSNYGK